MSRMKPSLVPRGLGRTLTAGALAVALCAAPALATWSIVVVNTKTGEVAVATSTCLSGNIQTLVPLVVPGIGCGATQSFIDQGAVNRIKIWRGLHNGNPPLDIFKGIQETDGGYQTKQIGIVDLFHDPLTFTGSAAGVARFGVAGVIGDLRYAIQGNVLSCQEVIVDAEAALLATQGDLGQKLMAAMQAARARGGDGRCSCSQSDPTGCGCPPPAFNKSAHNGSFIVSRIGDAEGDCTAQLGCANGAYYLNLNIIGSTGDPVDPVVQLQNQYDAWRLSMTGVPDQVQSLVLTGAPALVADGHSKATVDAILFDLEGQAIGHGGHAVSVQLLPGSAGATSLGPIVDRGDGTYGFDIVAGSTPGSDLWRITVSDGTHAVVLRPDIAVRVDPFASLHCGYGAVSAASGAAVPFTLNLGTGQAGASYQLLGSASGTSPGIPFGGGVLPLNLDAFMRRTIDSANGPAYPGWLGTLDADGRATPSLIALQGMLDPFAGAHLDFAAAILSPVQSTTIAVGFDVLP